MKKITVFEEQEESRVILQEEYINLSSMYSDGLKTRHWPGSHKKIGELIEKSVFDRMCKKKGRILKHSIPKREETGRTKHVEPDFAFIKPYDLIERVYYIPE